MFELIGDTKSILINIISSQLNDVLNKYKDDRAVQKLLLDINEFVSNMEKTNPTTVICKDSFCCFIKNYNVFGNFVNFYIQPNCVLKVTKGQYIGNIIEKCKAYLNEQNIKVSITDSSLIDDLFHKIVSMIEFTIEDMLSLKDRYIINQIKRHDVNISKEHLQFETELLDFITSVGTKCNELGKTLNEKLDKVIEFSNYDNNQAFSQRMDAFVNFANRPDINLELVLNPSNEGGDGVFEMSTCVKYKGLMSKFDDTNKYLNYLIFTGESDDLEVVNFTVSTLNEVIAEGKLRDTYTGPVCYLPKFTAKSMKINDVEESIPHIFENMIITITPPVQTFVFDIEDDDSEKIIENVEMCLTRHYVKQNVLEVKFNDIRKIADTKFNLSVLFDRFQVVSTSINILAKEKHEIHSALSYYQLLRRLSTSKKIVIRDKSTGLEFMNANTEMNPKYIDNLNNRIDFYKKLLSIQDHFKVQMLLPNEFKTDDVILVNQISDLIKFGITRTSAMKLKVKKKGIIVDDNMQIGTEYLASYTFKSLDLYGANIQLNKATMLLPNTTFKEETKKHLVFVSEEPCICVWNEKYGEFDQYKLAEEEVRKFRNEVLNKEKK